MGQLPLLSEEMGQTWIQTLNILGIRVGLSEDERLANDMTQTGKFCPSCKKELEKVSGEARYTCHWCGGIFILGVDGNVEEVWFEGFGEQ